MARNPLLGTDTVAEAYPKINLDFIQCFVNIAEVVAARDGQATLLAQIQYLQTQLSALASGSGVVISADDTTAGYHEDKVLPGAFMSFATNSPGGNETRTITNTNIMGWY